MIASGLVPNIDITRILLIIFPFRPAAPMCGTIVNYSLFSVESTTVFADSIFISSMLSAVQLSEFCSGFLSSLINLSDAKIMTITDKIRKIPLLYPRVDITTAVRHKTAVIVYKMATVCF